MKILATEKMKIKGGDSYEVFNNVINAVPEPLVSIRTVTYQHKKFIKDCIEGVLMQKTNFPIEFIIGEDFSTDGTREIVFEYAKKNQDTIRVITANNNVGSWANGQRSYQAARGKYIAVCDGDDYWTDPLKLQKQVDFLENNPEYVLAYHKFKNVNGNGKLINNKKTPLPCTLLFINDFSNMPSMKGCPNGDSFIKTYLSMKGSFKYLEDISPSVRRIHEGGVMSMVSEGIKLDRQARTYTMIYEAFKDSELGTQLYRVKNIYTYKKMLHDWSVADKKILEGLILYPMQVKHFKLYALFFKTILGIRI